jgi:hypothetical protein
MALIGYGGTTLNVPVTWDITRPVYDWPADGDSGYAVTTSKTGYYTLNSSESSAVGAWTSPAYTMMPTVKVYGATGTGHATCSNWVYPDGAGTLPLHVTWTINGTTCPTVVYPQKTRREVLQEIIRERHAPAAHFGRKPLALPADEREARARDTLRRVIGEQAYRCFLISGQVSVRSPRSGLTYVIRPGHGLTKVLDKGRFVETLCVVLPGNFPPTDSLITRYLMILNDERHFRSLANVGTFNDDRGSRMRRVVPAVSQSLVEVASNLPVRYRQVG